MPSTVSALYVHVPFCRRRCAYCDFYSRVLDTGLVPSLVEALCFELRRHRELCDLRPATVFVGGGTPTVLPAGALAALLASCGTDVVRDGTLEFTVEANPATVTPEVARTLAGASVNRVSLGAQSFDNDELATLERLHTPGEVGATMRACREHGITRISLDLIFGIPGQTLASWRSSLQAAIALGPEHMSCYGLTYESGTPLHARREAGTVTPIDPDLEADMYEATIDDLAAAGYHHYEISNFAKPGAECRHNLVYWRNEPYVGVGPSAAGFVNGVRYQNVADVAEYVRRVTAGNSPREFEERLDDEQRAKETAMLALRLSDGIDRAGFAARFGHDPLAFFRDAVDKHVAAGLLEVTDTNIRLTRRGCLLADTVIVDFL
ncbi:MAG: radical SAM family heme chaperone HemW [Phycisphaerae bacterium]|nr:radical SAM family heme chaperone HemW [Phycisphaerae bacterium]